MSAPSRARVVLVTGATNGIGYQTALALLRQGHHVIIHGRDPARGQAATEQLRQASGNPNVEYANADFTALQEVRALAEQVARRHERLDVLINNAGVFATQRQLTRNGYERTFAINHLAPFVLTLHLLERLQRSGPARIVNVSSNTHRSARVDWNNLQGERRYDGYSAYALSKLGNVLFTHALARRLAQSGSAVTANSLHPGVFATNLLRAGWGGGGGDLARAAETPVYVATSEEVAGRSGLYFVDRRPTPAAPLSYDEDLQERFWQASQHLVDQALRDGAATAQG